MKHKRHTPRQIMRKLRLAVAELSSGTAFEDVLKRLEVGHRGHLFPLATRIMGRQTRNGCAS